MEVKVTFANVSRSIALMTVETVQNNKKKRSQSDKIGRLKYNQQLLKQTLAEVEEVKLMLRIIYRGQVCSSHEILRIVRNEKLCGVIVFKQPQPEMKLL
jgi:hypothetical protein